MKQILFLSPYPIDKAPSQRLKYEQYYSAIRKNGYYITTSSFVGAAFWKIIYKEGFILSKLLFTLQGYLRRVRDILVIRKYDVVYVHLWVVPFGPPLFEWMVGRLAKRLIYDIDDLIFLKPKSTSNPLANLIKSRNNSIQLMKAADHVISCTPVLDEFVKKYNSNSTDISSTVDTEVYLPVNRYKNDHKLVIGWSGSHSTVKYLRLLDPVFQKLAKEFHFILKVIGTDQYELNGVETLAVPWTMENEVSELQGIDIGVYPLPDEEWVYGKSGLKAIQYMALGIPTVATDIGTIHRIIDSGKSGLLVSNENDWQEALTNLLIEEGLRETIGQAGRKVIEANYSIEANTDKYLKIIDAD